MSACRSLQREPVVANDPTTDQQLVTRVVEGHVGAFTQLMRRYNCRLFRVVRAVLPDDAEAEDACQEAWMRAYAHLDRLQHAPAFSAWLCRIGLRCGLERMAHRRGFVSLDELDRLALAPDDEAIDDVVETQRLASAAERAIDELMPSHRVVVLLRDVEHMTTAEVAAILEVSEENVRVRLHRARARLRELLVATLGAEVRDVFRFDGERCDRMVGALVRRIYSDMRYCTRSDCSFSVSPRSISVS
ncbi:MAG TPA: sigma-70 family RNA polymerase sigma factor [Nannocystaceae bacterium]|nr:sigma-70 family RNA polymerase sigma factor [Nannocystaceae bacterium]